ncbi:MAG: peptide chain release factor N(5)-glutamine methyltransferase [Mycobacterium sp.]
MSRQASRLSDAIDAASAELAAAGIDSARFDAEELAAHAAGTDRGRLRFCHPDESIIAAYRELVAARAARIPLQHLTGVAAFGPLLLAVGPGVFIPRPETESILEWAMAQPLPANPVIVDLCTGCGALALALAYHFPSARVIAVEDSPIALDYARRNAVGTAVELVESDVTATVLLPELTSGVDLVVANPPYIPDGADLEPEVAEHDPHRALFGGPDGMVVVTAVTAHAAIMLRPDGLFAVEHDDTTSDCTTATVTSTGAFTDVAARYDLTGRPRFVTARREVRT